MTPAEASTLIYDRWLANWTLASAFVGEPNKLDEGTVAYALLEVVHEPRQGDGQRTLGAVGNRRFDRQGRIGILINSPAKLGRAALDGMAHTARGIFEATRFSRVQCYSGAYRELGIEGKWHTGRVDILFDYEEIK